MKTFVLREHTVPLAAREGENGVSAIAVACGEWARDFPQGYGALLFRRQDGETYPLSVAWEPPFLKAVLTGTETAVPGLCLVEAQWRLSSGEEETVIAKAGPFRFRVFPALGGSLLPAPEPNWTDQILEAGARVEAAAEALDTLRPRVAALDGNAWKLLYPDASGENASAAAASEIAQIQVDGRAYLLEDTEARQQLAEASAALLAAGEELSLLTNLRFVRGTLYQGRAVTDESPHRCCMTDYVTIPYPFTVSIAEGYRYIYEYIDPSGAFTDESGHVCVASGWMNTAFRFPAGTRIRFAIRKETETPSEAADVAAYAAALTVTSRLDYLEAGLDAANAAQMKDIQGVSFNVTAQNYASVLPDLNGAPVNTVINLVFATGSAALPAHYPLETYRGTVNTLMTVARVAEAAVVQEQYLLCEDVVFSRFSASGGSYDAWKLMGRDLPEWMLNASRTLISAANYETLLPDCNGAQLFKLYSLNFAQGAAAFPLHTPLGSAWTDEVPTLFTCGTYTVRTQLWIGRDTIWRRYGINSGETWFAWQEIGNPVSKNRTYVVDKNGNGDYTSFLQCVKEAVKYRDSTVYVNAGDYDLAQEWGETYLESNSDDMGLFLGNGIHIIFSSNAKLTFHYAGSNSYILTEFAPFNADDQSSYLDYTLENLTLECSRCRYGIHDELHGTGTRATHQYLNCRIEIDNTNNAEWAGDCIGGGLGANAEIIVRNCIFKCQNNWENSPAFSWHNAKVPVARDAKSRLVIDGCYCYGTAGTKKGTFRFGYYGYSRKMTEVLISNCSFSDTPYLYKETEDDSPYVNAELIMWNNEIRGN